MKKRIANFTEEQLQELKSLYVSGMTMTNLSKKYKKDFSCIHRVLDKLFTKQEKNKIKTDLNNGIRPYLEKE